MDPSVTVVADADVADNDEDVVDEVKAIFPLVLELAITVELLD